jgi:hypothetical protein
MKGHVSKRGKTWAYWFDIDSDPLTGKRRQQTRSGFKSERRRGRSAEPQSPTTSEVTPSPPHAGKLLPRLTSG